MRSKSIWKISKCCQTIVTYHVRKASFCTLFFYFLFGPFCSKKTVQLIHSKKETISADLVASWTVHVGDMDQVLHLWRYTGGFAKIDKAEALLENDAVSTLIRNCLAHFGY